MPRSARATKVRELLRLVQLDGFEDAMPHQLSTGMKKRVSLGRALIRVSDLMHGGAEIPLARETVALDRTRPVHPAA